MITRLARFRQFNGNGAANASTAAGYQGDMFFIRAVHNFPYPLVVSNRSSVSPAIGRQSIRFGSIHLNLNPAQEFRSRRDGPLQNIIIFSSIEIFHRWS